MDARTYRGLPLSGLPPESGTPSPPPPPPSPSPRAAGACPPPVGRVIALAGASGSSPPLSTAADGNAGMYTWGACAAGLDVQAASVGVRSSRLVFRLALPPDAPPGGVLTLSTCGGAAAAAVDTVLLVGTGCPTWGGAFGCLAGNDNAPPGAPGCASSPRASRLSLALPTGSGPGRVFYVQVGGARGANVTAGLAWRYAPAAASASPTRPASRSRSHSRPPSPSRTRKPKRA